MRFLWICFLSIQVALACNPQLRLVEKEFGIPDYLLCAIAEVESGDSSAQSRPWIINANGQGMTFPTKEQAIEKVRSLRSQGVESIDVGIMQVNMKHHPNAFSSLENAFDPETNMRYAAQYLRQLRQDHGSWHTAVGYYHSATPRHNGPYKSRVLKAWAELMMRAVDGHQPLPKLHSAVLRQPVKAPQRPAPEPKEPENQVPENQVDEIREETTPVVNEMEELPEEVSSSQPAPGFISIKSSNQPFARMKTKRFAFNQAPSISRRDDGYFSLR